MISQQNRLRDALHDMAASAALGPVKKGRYLLPDDQLMSSYLAGRLAKMQPWM